MESANLNQITIMMMIDENHFKNYGDKKKDPIICKGDVLVMNTQNRNMLKNNEICRVTNHVINKFTPKDFRPNHVFMGIAKNDEYNFGKITVIIGGSVLYKFDNEKLNVGDSVYLSLSDGTNTDSTTHYNQAKKIIFKNWENFSITPDINDWGQRIGQVIEVQKNIARILINCCFGDVNATMSTDSNEFLKYGQLNIHSNFFILNGDLLMHDKDNTRETRNNKFLNVTNHIESNNPVRFKDYEFCGISMNKVMNCDTPITVITSGVFEYTFDINSGEHLVIGDYVYAGISETNTYYTSKSRKLVLVTYDTALDRKFLERKDKYKKRVGIVVGKNNGKAQILLLHN